MKNKIPAEQVRELAERVLAVHKVYRLQRENRKLYREMTKKNPEIEKYKIKA